MPRSSDGARLHDQLRRTAEPSDATLDSPALLDLLVSTLFFFFFFFFFFFLLLFLLTFSFLLRFFLIFPFYLF